LALSNKERQARYRERHLKDVDGEKTRLSLFVSIHAHRKMERVARHKSYTVTQLIEEWAEQAENRIVAKMSPNAEKEYFRKSD
jgi:hypothetical protein